MFKNNTHWGFDAQGGASILLSEGCWSACRSVLGQDTEPQIAPDVLVCTLQPPPSAYVWITVSRFAKWPKM